MQCIGKYSNQLTSVTIPNSVTSIGGSAFQDNQLRSVRVEATIPPTLGYDAFQPDTTLQEIKIPMASVAAYQVAPGWSRYPNIIKGY